MYWPRLFVVRNTNFHCDVGTSHVSSFIFQIVFFVGYMHIVHIPLVNVLAKAVFFQEISR